jgi:hypothetical protein
MKDNEVIEVRISGALRRQKLSSFLGIVSVVGSWFLAQESLISGI